jgi:hypothetical protein
VSLGWLERRRLVRDGFLLVPGAVPAGRVDAALTAINRSLGQGLPPDRLPELRARSFCPELIRAPEILGLYAGRARALAEAAIGAVSPPQEAQIALRFPQESPVAPVPHIDGMYTPTNGVAAGTLQHFTALLGIFLSDTPAAEMGNLVVWPGSHLALAEHFRQRGLQEITSGFPAVSLAQPRSLRVRAGDVVLSHYLLAHAGGPNRAPHVRYAVFFRLWHQDHTQAGTRPLGDPWALWEGVRPR